MWTNKITRAKQLREELQRELDTFFARQPYKIGTKTDPQSDRLIYYITKVDIVPEKIALITGDIIQNLRSSLDQLAYRLFTVGPGNGTDGRRIYFPIADDLNQYEREKVGKTEGLDQKAKHLIDTIKPYRGGNEILWKLHRLNIIDKHRLLITVGSSFGSVDLSTHINASTRRLISNSSKPFMSLFIKPANNLFPLKVGDKLFIDSPNAIPNPEMQFKFEIVLNEANIIDGASLIDTVNLMINEVESLVPKFEPLIT